jgi:RNA polymerase sigma-70 factor (ECF subfamily)
MSRLAPAAANAAKPAGVVHLPIPQSDAALVAALRAGRNDAKIALFERHAKHVQRVLARVLGSDPDLSDLIHDVFVAALTSLGKLEDPNALRSWLTKIAVFTAKGCIRRRVRRSFIRLHPDEELPHIPTEMTSPEISQALRCTYRILNELDADERIAFTLRFIDGMELAAIADACDVSLSTVKRRVARAQAKFTKLAQLEPALADWTGGGA